MDYPAVLLLSNSWVQTAFLQHWLFYENVNVQLICFDEHSALIWMLDTSIYKNPYSFFTTTAVLPSTCKLCFCICQHFFVNLLRFHSFLQSLLSFQENIRLFCCSCYLWVAQALFYICDKTVLNFWSLIFFPCHPFLSCPVILGC